MFLAVAFLASHFWRPRSRLKFSANLELCSALLPDLQFFSEPLYEAPWVGSSAGVSPLIYQAENEGGEKSECNQEDREEQEGNGG